ncbi:MAG: hypothetical protein JJU33_12535 [Phycisphaerales bacterium]|nr:hypothetical protein [Phycisphaerales bacterium]
MCISQNRSRGVVAPRHSLGAVSFGALSLLLACGAAAQIDTDWIGPISGNWADPANWTNGAPTNDPLDRYRVRIQSAGPVPLFTSTVSNNHAVETLTLDAPTGTLELSAGILSVEDRLDLLAGRLRFAGGTLRGGSIGFSGGELSFTNTYANRLEGISLENGDLLLAGGWATIAGGITLNGNAIDLTEQGSRLRFEGSQTLSDGSLFADASPSLATRTIQIRQVSTGEPAILTIAPDAVVRGGSLEFNGVAPVGEHELRNHGVISADQSGRQIGIRILTVTNDGLMAATDGGTLRSLSPDFTNNGILRAENGGLIELFGTWTNPGLIELNNASLTLGGTFTRASLGNVVGLNSSSVTLAGTWNNAGETITFNESFGEWLIDGGTISGGTLVFDGVHPRISSSNDNALVGVSIQGGDLRLVNQPSGSSSLRIVDGIELNGNAIDLSPQSSGIVFVGDANIESGSILSTSQAGSTRRVLLRTSPFVESQTLTIGPDASIRGGRLEVVGSAGQMRFVNKGDVISELPDEMLDFRSNLDLVHNEGLFHARDGGYLRMQAQEFLNSGVVRVDADSSFEILISEWRNTGAIELDGGAIILGGRFATDDMGTLSGLHTGRVDMTGRWDNSGESFELNASTGSWTVAGGTITGGVVRFNGAGLGFTDALQNLFDGVSVEGGDLALGGGRLNIQNGILLNGGAIDLSGPGSLLRFDGEQSIIDGSIVVTEAGGAPRQIQIRTIVGAEPASFTIGPNAEVSGGAIDFVRFGLGDRSVINEGVLVARVAGETLRVQDSILGFVNHGLATAVDDGVLRILSGEFENSAIVRAASGGMVEILSPTWSNGGVFEIDGGSIRLGGSFATENLGQITGASTGDLRISGSWNNSDDSFTFNSATGSWLLDGGTINGGTLVLDGAGLRFTGSVANRLAGVSIENDDLVIADDNGRLTLTGGLRLGGNRLDLAGESTTVRLLGSQTISDGMIVSEATDGGVRSIEIARIPGPSGTEVKIAEDASIRGARLDIRGAGGGSLALVVEGALSADIPNERIRVFGTISDLTNDGVMQAINGATLRLENDASMLTNLGPSGVLTGGTYRVGEGSHLDFGSAGVTRNEADIELMGAAAIFPALAALTSNAGRMSLSGEAVLPVQNGVHFEPEVSVLELLLVGSGDALVAPRLSLGGEADLGGDLVLDFTQYALAGITGPQTRQFIEASVISGEFETVSIIGIHPGLVSIDLAAGTLTVVPSPAPIAALAFAGLIASRRQRIDKR